MGANLKKAAGDFLLSFYLSPLLKSLQASWNFTAGPPADSGSKVASWSRKMLENQSDPIFIIDLLVHTSFLFWQVVTASGWHPLKVTHKACQIFRSPWLSPVHLVTKS